ncbi:mitochondrial calcium uptake 1, putative [Leishmania panamensis]|uniref:Mitochondrial calcium uptake 1, putative n=1 Tax=Leishmania panamensis TaxID=5679 RepID=A0A088RKN3_LEIPA|nr:mitochondrial calcium uptake 1, putative [Leishmania panamensis]AIN95699.1 mitochondrial calcium uptake 1, putative [Leishmania panamensis]
MLAGWCVGVALCIAAGTTVVLCRSYDTPPYLIPYYLRDVRSRFLHYASVRKRKGGPMYMTVEDFVLALLASPEKVLPNPAIVQDLQRLFESMDANGDGYISFPEFRFLMSLLTSNPRDVETLFRIVDTDKSGTLSLEEFANVLRGATKDEAVVRSLLKPSTRRNGVVRALFGDEAAPRKCSLSELEAVIRSVRTEVWKAEFRQYDVEQHDCITAEEFAALIARQVLGSHLPYYLVENIRCLHGSGDVVTLNMWLGLNEAMLYADQLAAHVEMFLSSGMPVTKRDFHRLMSMTEVSALPNTTVDIIFALFDKNGDGSMEIDEFLFIMRKKVRYHYSVPPRMRKSLPRRFLECSSELLTDLGR